MRFEIKRSAAARANRPGDAGRNDRRDERRRGIEIDRRGKAHPKPRRGRQRSRHRSSGRAADNTAERVIGLVGRPRLVRRPVIGLNAEHRLRQTRRLNVHGAAQRQQHALERKRIGEHCDERGALPPRDDGPARHAPDHDPRDALRQHRGAARRVKGPLT